MSPGFRKFLSVVSSVLGWAYFVCWSVSFYPQAYINFKRKSVTGLSVDFVVLSFVGFLCYAAFTVCLYWVGPIKHEYEVRYEGHESLVELNDVIFTLHASAITFVYVVQVLLYRKPGENMSKVGWSIMGGFSLFVVVFGSLCLFGRVSWLTFLVILTYFKLALTVVKYIPQVYLNYVRKSTLGWSIINVMLDFSGGVFSIAQIMLDSALSGHWDGIKGFMVKLTLGIVTLVFDTIFLLQHFYWFPHASGPHLVQVYELDESDTDAKGAKPGMLMTSVIPPTSASPSIASSAKSTTERDDDERKAK